MVEVEMTKDIRDYEPKLFGVVTARQIVCLAVGLAYSVPLAFVVPGELTTKFMVAAIAMIPVIMMGWISVYGMRLEQFLSQAVRSLVLTPRKRKYKRENTLDFLYKQPEVSNKKPKITKSPDFKPMK